MTQLTSEQVNSCVKLLSKLEPGFLPIEIFNQIARLVRLPMVDVVPIKLKQHILHVGLIKKEADNLWWPNMWHLPGTVLRSTDSIDDAINRVIHDEIKIENNDKPVFRTFLTHRTKRGTEVVLIYSVKNCKFLNDSLVKWFPINELPENFIESEKVVIDSLKENLNLDRISFQKAIMGRGSS